MVWKNHIYWDDYLFIAKDIIIQSTNVPVMNMNPNNRVGEPSTASFTFTAPVDLETNLSGAFDKIVIFTEKT
jgi:hypothetical protein